MSARMELLCCVSVLQQPVRPSFSMDKIKETLVSSVVDCISLMISKEVPAWIYSALTIFYYYDYNIVILNIFVFYLE